LLWGLYALLANVELAVQSQKKMVLPDFVG
jgi:hypothetical protein